MARSAEFNSLPGTDTQAGVGYVQSTCPTLSSGNIVPIASTCTISEEAAEVVVEDKTADPVRLHTSGHKLVYSGSFKLKTGTAMPNYGATLTDADGKKWLVMGEPPQLQEMVGGYPAVIRMRLEYWPGAQGSL